MVNKSSNNNNSNRGTSEGNTVVILHDGDKNNHPNLALTTEYQRPSSGTDIDNILITEQILWKRILSWRSFIVALLHISYVLNMAPVSIMAMSLVCMCGPVRRPIYDIHNNSRLHLTSTDAESRLLENITVSQEKMYEFNWDSETRGLLMSGYLFTAFLAPQLSNVVRGYIGNKMTMTLSSVSLAFLSFVSPIAARTNVYFFLAIRILSGLCIHTNVPVSADTLAWWIPASEKLTSSTTVTVGYIVGGSLSSVISGYFCKAGVDNGWPWSFYFHGVLLILWTIAWHSLSSQKPENHPYISEQEKAYILACRVGMNTANTEETESTPYRKILTSRPMWALVVSSMFHVWALVVIFTCLPLYMTSVLKFSVPDSGSIFSVMYIIRLPGALLWSAVGNWLLGRKYMTTNKVRKICFGFGEGLATVFCLSVSFLDASHKWLACVLVGAAFICVTFGVTMSTLISLDMAPRYAGFMCGIISTLSSLASLTAPLATTAITEKGTFEQWRVVWIIMTLAYFTAGVVFLIFGNASLQSWAVPKTVSPADKLDDQSSPSLDPKLMDDAAGASLLTPQLRT